MNPPTRQAAVSQVFPLVALLLLRFSATAPADDPAAEDLSQFYGFRELEIVKLERRSHSMLPGDFNHDGRTDLAVVDNSHSRIDLLIQREAKPDVTAAAASQSDDVNALGSHWRFEHRKLPVDREVAALAVGDLNGDGRHDLAYFGDPDRLVIARQPEQGEWTERETFRLPDVAGSQWILACGDLNGDDRNDLAVLGKMETFLFHQTDDGKLDGPQRLLNTSDKLGLAQIADLDGDGRGDLCYVANDEQERTLCARLSHADGTLGPELRFDLKGPRSISLAEIDPRPGREIVTVDSRTGRIELRRLKDAEAEAGRPAERLVQYGFGETGSGRNRDLAAADIDGDGLSDVVVTDPESAQLVLFRQQAGRGLDLGQRFPGLLGATQVRAEDLDGDGGAEVVILSAQEKAIGLARFAEGRLTFPETLSVEHEPLAIELADLDADGTSEILYVSRQREGRDSKYALAALAREDAGGWVPRSFGEEKSLPLELPAAPDRLVRLDANRDRMPDFLLFFGSDRAPRLLVTGEDGVPKPVESAGGIELGNVSTGAVFVGGPDRSLVLVALGRFARNLRLDAQRRWEVVDQYNAGESNARIAGVAALDLDGEPGDEIVLVDTGVRKLRLLKSDGQLHRPWREVELGGFPYLDARAADLDGDGRDDLVLFGGGKFAVLYAGRRLPQLEELATYESKLERTFTSDVVTGDVNGDGRADLAALDTRTHYLELLTYDATQGLRKALHFKVFEEKSFSPQLAAGTEPREGLIVDVTGDGRSDLVLLTHDRVLVYPQDDGR
ncbi:MAG: VCBS repeat-containing protein [Planctomycetes bacterium]|nr:VCBS repeat-containing protein [Planctomycetota bacterium]